METLRAKYLEKSKRIVIKVGSRLLVDMERMDLNQPFMKQLVKSIAEIRATGREVVLVSSGAVGAGMARLGMSSKPTEVAKVQACASVGQIQLSHVYENLFRKKGITIGQVLVSAEDFRNRSRYKNISNTLEALLEQGCVPVINENDSVAVEEIKVGDNDKLSADVTHFLKADLLVIFTDEDGLYDANPKEDPDAKLISTVSKITKATFALASGKGSAISTGGMKTKLIAIKQATDAGCAAILANGFKVTPIELIQGAEKGTFFIPSASMPSQRKRWIGLVSDPKSSVIVDQGAIKAIKGGRSSVLLVGVKGVEGRFTTGELVNIKSLRGTVVARGVVGYRSEEMQEMAGMTAEEAKEWALEHHLSPKKNAGICIHRNDMYLV